MEYIIHYKLSVTIYLISYDCAVVMNGLNTVEIA